MTAPSLNGTAAALAAVNLLEGTPLAPVITRFGHVLHDRRVEGCPRAACRAQPFGVVEFAEVLGGKVVFTRSEGRPRVSIIGDGWICWACGAFGGAAQWAAHELGLDVGDAPPAPRDDTARLRDIAARAFKSHPSRPHAALAAARSWARRNTSLDAASMDAVLVEVAASSLANGWSP